MGYSYQPSVHGWRGVQQVPTFRTVPLEEIVATKKRKMQGPRVKARIEFDGYVKLLLEDTNNAMVFTGFKTDEERKFIVKFQAALERAGVEDAHVRKTRGSDEVRAWVGELPEGDTIDDNAEDTTTSDGYDDEDAQSPDDEEDDDSDEEEEEEEENSESIYAGTRVR